MVYIKQVKNPHFDITYTINGYRLTKKVFNQLMVVLDDIDEKLHKDFKNKAIGIEKTSSCVELMDMREPEDYEDIE